MPKLCGVSTYGWRMEIDEDTRREDGQYDEDLNLGIASSATPHCVWCRMYS